LILFYTPNSPYARTSRIALREWNILPNVEERIAANRQADNPVLEFSPVGRVPTLIHDALTITEASRVFSYIEELASADKSTQSKDYDWSVIAEEGQLSGFLEGIAFWIREKRRAPEEQSQFLLQVEHDRMLRCLDYIEKLAQARRLPDVNKFRTAALACALDLMDYHDFHPQWRNDNHALASWFGQQIDRPSMKDTAPII
jgi:glutathione S-transferase